MTFNIIVAMDRKQGIGVNNTLPWKLSKDLKNFARLTKGNGKNAIVMGRKTYESIGKPLRKRTNIVLSTTMEQTEGIEICRNVNQVLEYCIENQFEEVWIIGGGSIYDEFLKIMGIIDRIYITLIDYTFECDTIFNFSNYSDLFTCYSNIADTDNGYNINFLKYKKKEIIHYMNSDSEEVWEGYGEGKFL